MRELPDPSPGTPLPPLISILLCWDLKDPLVEEAASGGSSPDGEEALFQLSKSEATPGEPACYSNHSQGRLVSCLESHSRGRAGIFVSSSPSSTDVFHQPMLWLAGAGGTGRWWDMKNQVHICPWDYRQLLQGPFFTTAFTSKTLAGDVTPLGRA